MKKKLDFNDLSREALNEVLEAVEQCILYRKKEHEQWADSSFPGCLGIPASILLFSIADAIGSYHRNNGFKVVIDGKLQAINNTAKHLYVFNSKFYGYQELTSVELNVLYYNYRSILTHNLGLPGSHILILDPTGNKLIEKKQGAQNDNWVLNLNVFFKLTKTAVEIFLPDSEEIIKNSSAVKDEITKKETNLFGGIDTFDQMYSSTSSNDHVSPSGTNYTLPPHNLNH